MLCSDDLREQGDGDRVGREAEEGGDVCLPMAESCCSAEAITALESNYIPKKRERNLCSLKVMGTRHSDIRWCDVIQTI